MTNAEKIRNMTDEDLAMMLMCPAEYDESFNKQCGCNGSMDKNCLKCTIAWLHQESEG